MIGKIILLGTLFLSASCIKSTVPPSETAAIHGLPPAVYAKKVKTLLTGHAASEAEIKALESDPGRLPQMIESWMQLPSYGPIMERFYADAFQQSQVQVNDFGMNVDDGETRPNNDLLENFRSSFAKTVTALEAEGRSFQEVTTTRRFMMTTAMMMFYSMVDTSSRADATADGRGRKIDRMTDADPNWSFRLTSRKKIPWEDSLNPASPDYLTFFIPDLPERFSKMKRPKDDGPRCSKIDPVVYDGDASPGGPRRLSHWLYRVLTGDNFNFVYNPTGDPSIPQCKGKRRPSILLQPSDYNDWRMVEIKPLSEGAPQARFFDIPGLRQMTSLHLYAPRVGYFTTPAFFAQYNTNVSNQARGIINQTMIVGLNRGFDGSTGDMSIEAPGADPEHASKPACYACHSNMDPMKRFFRANYSLNFGPQLDPKERAVTGTFIFDGLVKAGSSMDDLGREIAEHPGFAMGWAQKLCAYANSASCSAGDPELQRIAAAFAASQFQWKVLVRELFASPLVTFANIETLPATTLARRTQLCAILDSRLGFRDLCGFGSVQNGAGGKSIPSLALQLPADQYSRGQQEAIYIQSPDPFYMSSLEKICALASERVVDKVGNHVNYSSAEPEKSIAAMARDLMGLGGAEQAEVAAILGEAFQKSKAKGADDATALKSSFVLACMSPAVSSISH